MLFLFSCKWKSFSQERFLHLASFWKWEFLELGNGPLKFGSVCFWGEGKPDYPGKNLSERGREPTTNWTCIWLWVCCWLVLLDSSSAVGRFWIRLREQLGDFLVLFCFALPSLGPLPSSTFQARQKSSKICSHTVLRTLCPLPASDSRSDCFFFLWMRRI